MIAFRMGAHAICIATDADPVYIHGSNLLPLKKP